MSEFFDFHVHTRPYTGYVEPGLPIGSWIAGAEVIGTASGGFLVMSCLFQHAETVRVTELFNLEQLSMDVAQSTPASAFITTLRMDILAPGTEVDFGEEQRWLSLLQTDGVGEASMSLADQAGLPLWLGAPSVLGVDAGLRFEFRNANLIEYTVTAQGYMWGPRSVIAPGGPQRPPFGFFGP